MDNIDERFARSIRKLREEQGLSQEALGNRAGLSAKYVGQIERRIRGTTLRAAEKIARALGVPLRSVLGDEDGQELPLVIRETAAKYGSSATLQRLIALLRRCREADLALVERLMLAWQAPARKRARPPRTSS